MNTFDSNKMPVNSEMLLRLVLLNGEDNDTPLMDIIPSLQRHSLKKTTIFIEVTSSSIPSGALEAKEAIQCYVEERELEIDIIEVGSNGLCCFSPIMDVQIPGRCRVSFKNVASNIIPQILDGVLNNYLPNEFTVYQYRNSLHQPWPGVPYFDELSFFKNQQRLLLEQSGVICPNLIEDYIAWGGYKAFSNAIRTLTHENLCNLVEESGLRGRGGGAFLTGKKWKIALQTPSNQKYLICNADESDPGAFMNRLLAESNPHLVIEGIALASYAIGASKAIVYTRNRYRITVQRLENAIKQAYSIGFLGHNILDSGFNLDITVRKGPGAYVCGEETALIQSLEGKRGTPITKPPFPATMGLFHKPTIVNNIETLANIPIIVRNGVELFSSIGTSDVKGTKIFSVTGKVNQTCMVELPFGTPLSKLVELSGGVTNGKEVTTILLGGPSGCFVLPDDLNLPIDYDNLKSRGISIGAGGVVVVDNSSCIIDLLKYLIGFMKRESCGKCIPCREGTSRMLETFEKITKRPLNDDDHATLDRFKSVVQLEGLAEVMRDTSLCGFGQTAANPILSAIKNFRNVFEEHIFDRLCTSKVCRDLRTYYIDIDRCTGCNACAKKCPTNAIIGTPRSPYYILEEKCIGCGNCEEVCKFSAVFFK